jgi:integrase
VTAPPELPFFAPETLEDASPPAQALAAWVENARDAYPPNTRRAWRADWRLFAAFCAAENEAALPATAETVTDYLKHLGALERPKRLTTMRRYLSTIARAHRAAGLANPCDTELVRTRLRAIARQFPSRPRQVRALNWEQLPRFLNLDRATPQHIRACALVCVAYDAMLRRSELVAIDWEDIEASVDGAGTVLIRRSKTDTEGEGFRAYLSPEAMGFLEAWAAASVTSETRTGPVFRSITKGGMIGPRLGAQSVATLYKQLAREIGMVEADVAAVSGHSLRVGAAQDLVALNLELAAVMREGRWKSTRMPMQYAENLLAGRGAMAKAALLQQRSASIRTSGDLSKQPTET